MHVRDRLDNNTWSFRYVILVEVTIFQSNF